MALRGRKYKHNSAQVLPALSAGWMFTGLRLSPTFAVAQKNDAKRTLLFGLPEGAAEYWGLVCPEL